MDIFANARACADSFSDGALPESLLHFGDGMRRAISMIEKDWKAAIEEAEWPEPETME